MQGDDFIGRDYLTLMDFTAEEIRYMLHISADFKVKRRRREAHDVLRGRTAALIFEKQSTRTRTSFEAACSHLGMDSFYMMPAQMQLGRGEPIKDTARVIDRYCDALFIRTFGQEIVEEYAGWMRVPVINALTDLTHPCQGLADLLTIQEHIGQLEGFKLCYAGDVWNVCHSLMICGSLLGFDVYVAAPADYPPSERVMKFVAENSARTGAVVKVTQDFDEALEEADVVYANTWHSMGGPEKTKEQRIIDFSPYQVNQAAMKKAKKDAIFMHCLPGYRGEDMTDEVIEGSQSVVFDQAENRMHTEKAILYLTVE
jgi:ornithine carbamoyltransferase